MQINPTNVTTGQVRLSYVHLFAPYARPGQEPKYSVTLLIPKSDVATKQRIDAAINAAVQAGVASKWGGVRPIQPKTPVWDGDGVRQTGEAFGPECKGHWVMTASSKQPQAVVDLSLNPIINQTEIYSGIYARVNINFFPYFNSGNKGVGCGLGPVQKVADGEPLGGGISAEAAFGGSAGQPYTPPVQPGYPQQQPNYGHQQQPVYPAQPVYSQPQYHQQPAQPQGQPQYQPVYPNQQPIPLQQPQYHQQPAQPQGQPQYQPVYPNQQPIPLQQPQPAQIDPITGMPIVGQVMGL